MRQLHDQVVFEPIRVNGMANIDRKKEMKSLIFLNKQRYETIKSRMCANGSKKRAYITCEEATSPTAASEYVITTRVIDTKHKREMMTLDTPNAFVHTEISLEIEKIIMKIRGQLIDIIFKCFKECTINMSGTNEGRIFSTYRFSKNCRICSFPWLCNTRSSERTNKEYDLKLIRTKLLTTEWNPVSNKQ